MPAVYTEQQEALFVYVSKHKHPVLKHIHFANGILFSLKSLCQKQPFSLKPSVAFLFWMVCIHSTQ